MRLGAVSLMLKYRDVPIGALAFPGVSIRPGANELIVQGLLSAHQRDLATVSELFSKYVSGQQADVTIQGISASLPDGSAPAWLSRFVRSVKMDFALPPAGRILEGAFTDVALANVEIGSASGGRDDDNDDSTAQISADVSAIVNSPFGVTSPITVLQTSLKFDVFRPPPPTAPQQFPFSAASIRRRLQTDQESTLLGSVHVTGLPVTQDAAGGDRISLGLRNSVMNFRDSGKAFAQFALDVLRSKEEFALSISGSMDVLVKTQMGTLSLSNIPMAAPFSVLGLGVLAETSGGRFRLEQTDVMGGVEVSDFPGAHRQAIVMKTAMTLDNQSSMSVNIGRVMMGLSYEGKQMGAIAIDGFRVRPGRNSLDAIGVLRPEDLVSFSSFVSRFLMEKHVTISLNGLPGRSTSSGVDGSPTADAEELTNELLGGPGVRSPGWVQRLLETIQLDVPVNESNGSTSGSNALLKEVDLRDVSLDLRTSANPLVSGNLDVQYSMPPQFKITHQVLSVDASVNIDVSNTDGQQNEEHNLMGAVYLRSLQPMMLDADSTTLTFQIEPTEVIIPKESGWVLSQLLYDVMHSKGESFLSLRGTAMVSLSTALGTVTLSRLPVGSTKSIKHLGGMLNSEAFSVDGVDVVRGGHEGLFLDTSLNLRIPGDMQIGVKVGSAMFDLYYPVGKLDVAQVEQPARDLVADHADYGRLMQIGAVQIPNLEITGGKANTLDAEVVILRPVFDNNHHALRTGPRELLSNYVNGDPTTLVVLGNAKSITSPYLKQALGSTSMVMELPGATEKMLQEVQLDVKISFLIPQIKARTVLKNTMSVPISIRYANMTTYSDDINMGEMVVDRRDNPDVMPPLSVHVSPPAPITPKLRGGAVQAFRSAISSGGTIIKAVGEMEVAIDGYVVGLDVDMHDVPLTF
eukprot:GHVS01089596.1.p1 GENE.GHVS01089596.1~~GHVS01089596.1.p1  ORF type:complete len:915 (-),score=106.73 GHVS01089596.1:528-3272(-)